MGSYKFKIESFYTELGLILKDKIECYEERVQLALSVIGIDRTSLQHADARLYNEISSVVSEYIIENEIEIDIDDIDIEDIMFNS